MFETANYNIKRKVLVFTWLILQLTIQSCVGQQATSFQLGAEQLNSYIPSLKNKSVAVVVNQTSTIGSTHLVDTLVTLGVQVNSVFAPEHGFRGTADAGAKVASGMDEKTGLPIISLYGKNKKPSPEQLTGIDIVIFDIQDVGTRFYTYISTMHYVMEACAENNIEVIILDRPNPNGKFIDGPVLDLKHQSFVGMHPIPILHGLTVGELALMINGERWLKDQLVCDLTIIDMQGYTHDMPYTLPIKPSPNLPTDLSIALYPSLCLFEGTPISVGRGTVKPFEQIGHPQLKAHYQESFKPESVEGAKHPPFEGEVCYGIQFEKKPFEEGINLSYLIEFYGNYPDQESYFNNFFAKLAGTEVLAQQIEAGFTAEEITISWKPSLEHYKKMRNKYLLYP